MSEPLWTWDALVAAAQGVTDGTPPAAIIGFSIDSRGITPGDVFVALKDQRDGHDFVASAFASGAAAALVSTAYDRKAGDGALLRVDDPLRALERIGAAARARLGEDARVVAVTGSVGKTGTKEMLRACFSRLGATHAPEKSFNNHWGVPLTLARMPAATRYGVFEIGMNHAGEIAPLTRLVRPDVAIITTVEAVHLGNFASIEGIADAKAEILEGLVAGGVAVLNRDNPHFERLASAARAAGAAHGGVRIVSFGQYTSSDVHLVHAALDPDRSRIEADCASGRIAYTIATPGAHMVQNSLAVAAALEAATDHFEDLLHALGALATFGAPQGRGAREVFETSGGRILLIDESYNANPASMRAAFAALALVPRESYPRRIAVLGDMLELGERSVELHVGLKEAIEANGIDLVHAAGSDMKALWDALEPHRRGVWSPHSDGLVTPLGQAVHAGDAIMVKGSFGSRMGPVVAALRGLWSQTAT